jgi:hypothetical protein
MAGRYFPARGWKIRKRRDCQGFTAQVIQDPALMIMFVFQGSSTA